MNTELEYRLSEIAPILYSDLIKSRKSELSGSQVAVLSSIQVSNGWIKPLENLSRRIESLNIIYKKYRISIVATKIKKSFGRLRFYYDIKWKPFLFRRMVYNTAKYFDNLLNRYIKFKYENGILVNFKLTKKLQLFMKSIYRSIENNVPEYARNLMFIINEYISRQVIITTRECSNRCEICGAISNNLIPVDESNNILYVCNSCLNSDSDDSNSIQMQGD